MVVLTSWKNFGYGLDVDDPIWATHIDTLGVKGEKRKKSHQNLTEQFEGTRFNERVAYIASKPTLW